MKLVILVALIIFVLVLFCIKPLNKDMQAVIDGRSYYMDNYSLEGTVLTLHNVCATSSFLACVLGINHHDGLIFNNISIQEIQIRQGRC